MLWVMKILQNVKFTMEFRQMYFLLWATIPAITSIPYGWANPSVPPGNMRLEK